MRTGTSGMKHTSILILAAILALTQAYALTCGPGQDLPCPSRCQVDFGEGNVYPEYCPMQTGQCNQIREELGYDWCGNGRICVPAGYLSYQAQCCTPQSDAITCNGYCGRTVGNNCGQDIQCPTCATCNAGNVGSSCGAPDTGTEGAQYYCNPSGVCAACNPGTYWNERFNSCMWCIPGQQGGSIGDNCCNAGENPANAPNDCTITIAEPSPDYAYQWNSASATCSQLHCGDGGTQGQDCANLAPNPNSGFYCNTNGIAGGSSTTTGRCCPTGDYWNGVECVDTNQCGQVGTTRAGPDACCSVPGGLYGQNPYNAWTGIVTY
jgi:hypothetical protein